MGGPVEGVFATRLTTKPKANSIFHLLMPECPGEPPGRLVLSDILVKPLEMWRVDYEGNVFAYVATYEAEFVEKGVPHGSLKAYFLVFIDVDGAGKIHNHEMELASQKCFPLLARSSWLGQIVAVIKPGTVKIRVDGREGLPVGCAPLASYSL
jgi:hypothetical protein